MTKEQNNILEQNNSFYLKKINRLENKLTDVEMKIQNILTSIITIKIDDIKVAIDYMYIIENYYSIVCDLCSTYTYIGIKPPQYLYYLITKLTSEYYLRNTIAKIKDIMESFSPREDDFKNEYKIFDTTIKYRIYYLENVNLN